MPVGNIFLIPHARYNWKHTLSGNAEIGGRSINFPRGKLMGGCSAINGGVYIRGQREDYDAWEHAGNKGWAYKDVLPGFMAVENYEGPTSPGMARAASWMCRSRAPSIRSPMPSSSPRSRRAIGATTISRGASGGLRPL
jgi:choline dehydrogenase-like flavoprotein